MTLGLYEERARRKRRRRWTFVRWLILFGLIGAAAAFAYESGRSLAEGETTVLRGRLDEVSGQFEAAQQREAELQVALEQAQSARDVAETKLREATPDEAVQGLMSLAREKLADGVPLDRLAFLLDSAGKERKCNNKPRQKRFIVTTPLSAAGNDSVRFADGLLIVTAVGVSATNQAGKPEAWFDTAQPLTIKVTDLDGVSQETVGQLPVTFSRVLGEREYRFSMVAGARGFVEVTADWCRFP